MDNQGIGLITCNREDFFTQALESIPAGKFKRVYVVDASDADQKYAEKYRSKYGFKLISPSKRVVVGVAKNMALRRMQKDGIVHFFLMEDDVRIINEDIAEKYIETANTSGIWGTLAHNGHGNGNRDSDGNVEPKNTVTYDNGVKVDFFEHSVQPFVYIHRNIIKHVGLFDEFYKNAIEHLDHYKLQEVKRLGSYYHWFPSPADCGDDIEDIDENHEGSVIRRDESWQRDLEEGAKHFLKKYQYHPFNMPMAGEDQVLERLDYLEKYYAKKL
jgi:glycosyltransferase involved in cell wall biosynthesis